LKEFENVGPGAYNINQNFIPKHKSQN